MTTIFWNILQVSMTTAVVLLPVLLLCAVLRRRYPARVLCVLWVIFAVRLLIPVQNTFPDAPVQVTPRTTLVEVRTAAPPEDNQKQSEAPAEPAGQRGQPVARRWIPAGAVAATEREKTIAFDAIFAAVWMAGAVVSFMGTAVSYWRFIRRIRHTAHEVREPEWIRQYEIECGRLGLRRHIPLCQTSEADGPMLVGLFHPMLLLPEAGISRTEIPFILRHELTHAKHRDVLCKMVFCLARCVHWFNPVVYLLARQGAQDLEIACDQAVVRGLDADARRRYGQCILNDVARRLKDGTMLTTRLTGGGKAMKTRLQALYSQDQKRRGISALLVVVFALTFVGGCFAVTPKTGDTALEAEIYTAAQTYMQAIVDGDVQTVIDALPASVQEMQDTEQAESALLLANPHVTAYAVYPDAECLGAYIVKNWSQALYSSLAAPDQHTVQWVQFVREDGVLKVNETGGVAALCEKQTTDLSTVRDLGTFEMLYGDLGLPDVGAAMLNSAAGQITDLLGLAGGRLEPQGETTFHYTFFNGQQISIRTKPEGDGWKFDRWAVVEADAKPVDAATEREMEALSQRWCNAQVNGLTAADAATLLGGNLKALFEENAAGYADTDTQMQFEIDNLPIGVTPDRATYTADAATGTVTIQVHGTARNGVGSPVPRAWFSGMTQVQTLSFGWEDGGLRIVDRVTDAAMVLDRPEFCLTAADVLALGMPDDPVDSTSLEALVYMNFPVAGGRFHVVRDLVVYTFADGTMIYFRYEKVDGADTYRLTELIEPEIQVGVTGPIPVIQAANQWAEGYLRENAMFRYPFMSTEVQQQFVQEQQQLYGLHWFWRIGWGSSPDVTDWMLTEFTDSSVTVVYRLEAGGEQFRYAERLTIDTQDGLPVVTGCEALGATWSDLTREQFLQLYPVGPIDDLGVNPDEAYIQANPDRFQTPEDALRAIIVMFADEQKYQVTRIGDEIPVETGVDQDLKVTFPNGEILYLTMHQDRQGLWGFGRIWEDMPDHTV